jgi:hypothetical protein
MRFVYVDSGLRNDIGHHANCCRAAMAELRKRQIPMTVVGYSGADAPLKDELNILPLLSSYLYYLKDGDPLAGWLNAFGEVSRTTRHDLARIPNLSADDIVYVAAAYPGQLMGVIRWLGDRGPPERPFVLIDLLGHPGMEIRPNAGGGYVCVPRREDPRAMLYRYAANHIGKLDLKRLVISYADQLGAEMFSDVLGVQVLKLPLPFDAVTSQRNRAGKRPIVLALLGSQRNEEKGYHHVPEILRGLFISHPELRAHVHNSYPDNFPAATMAMRALANTEPRLTCDERSVDSTGWAQLLDAADLMLCPYDPEPYQFMNSGIQAEAIANAIPSVVPAGTSLSRALQEFGGGGTVFVGFEPLSILEATRRALDDFDQYSQKALTASEKWRDVHGAAKLVEAIIGLWRQNRPRL